MEGRRTWRIAFGSPSGHRSYLIDRSDLNDRIQEEGKGVRGPGRRDSELHGLSSRKELLQGGELHISQKAWDSELGRKGDISHTPHRSVFPQDRGHGDRGGGGHPVQRLGGGHKLRAQRVPPLLGREGG